MIFCPLSSPALTTNSNTHQPPKPPNINNHDARCCFISPNYIDNIHFVSINMVAVSVSLSDITRLSDLAARLGVDVRALQLVKLHPTAICKGKECILPAAESNRGFCVLCSQQWFPRNTSAELNRRGHGLYGPKFMCIYNNCTSPPKACCCDTPLCEKIGYSHEGMFRLPSKPEKDVKDFVAALGIQDKDLRDKIIQDPRNHRIAPWHISPDHREQVEGGKWRIKKIEVYKDRDGKAWKFAPPNYTLQDYVNVEIHVLKPSRQSTYYEESTSFVRLFKKSYELLHRVLLTNAIISE